MNNYHYNRWTESESLYSHTSNFQYRTDFFLSKFLQKQYNLTYSQPDRFYGVGVSYTDLRAIFGQKNYQTAIATLIADGVIERIEKPQKNKYGDTLYVFKAIESVPYVWNVAIPVYDKKFAKGVEIYYNNKENGYSEEALVQINNMRRTKIKVEYDDFVQSVTDYYPEYVESKTYKKEEPSSLEGYITSHELLWNRIKQFNGVRGRELYDFASEDNFGNRFHSIFTQLPKHLKAKGVIKINNEDTVELDLHQSQPTIAANILNDIQPDNDFSRTFFEEDDIYLYMQEKFGLSSRDEAKDFMYSMLFGKPFGYYHDTFAEMFPQAAAIIKNIKMTYDSTNPSHKIYSNFVRMLQLKESEIFREIWMALESDGIRFVSVHDSVIVQERHSFRTKEIMDTVISNHLTNFKIK